MVDGNDGKDDEGYDIDACDILCPSQYLHLETGGDPYPIGETLEENKG